MSKKQRTLLLFDGFAIVPGLLDGFGTPNSLEYRVNFYFHGWVNPTHEASSSDSVWHDESERLPCGSMNASYGVGEEWP